MAVKCLSSAPGMTQEDVETLPFLQCELRQLVGFGQPHHRDAALLPEPLDESREQQEQHREGKDEEGAHDRLRRFEPVDARRDPSVATRLEVHDMYGARTTWV